MPKTEILRTLVKLRYTTLEKEWRLELWRMALPWPTTLERLSLIEKAIQIIKQPKKQVMMKHMWRP